MENDLFLEIYVSVIVFNILEDVFLGFFFVVFAVFFSKFWILAQCFNCGNEGFFFINWDYFSTIAIFD